MANNFALNVNSPDSQIIASLNYALANMGSGTAAITYEGNILVANSATGVVQTVTSTGVKGPVYGYLYDYINVKYANSATGGSGFSSNCTMANYYGIHNSNSTAISTNPVDYQWTQVAGGFGTTKGLWYFNKGGNSVDIQVATVAPTVNYSPVPDNTAILLATVANAVIYGNVITPGSITNVQIASNTIVAQNIQNQAITSLKIANQTLTNAQIALSTITGNLIQSQTITGNLMALNTITGNLVALNTITGNLIAQQTITGNLIVPGTIYGNAILANSFQANTINGNSIVAGSITTDKLAANAITANTVVSYNAVFGDYNSPGYWLDGNTGNARFGGNLSVGNIIVGGNLAVGSVYGGIGNQIAYNSIDGNLNIIYGSLGGQWLADRSVFARVIANATITNAQIADRTLTNAQISLSTITGELIQAQTLTGNLIANNAITTQLIAANAITSNLIAYGSITNTAIAQNTITGNLIAQNTITGNLVAQNTITGNLMALNTITGNLIAGNTITGNLVALNTITGNLIAQNTITGNLVALNTITGNLIAQGTITGNLIAANTIYGNAIIANTIYGNAIIARTFAASSIFGNSIVANSIVANSIFGNAIVANTFVANSIYGNSIVAGSITAEQIAAGAITTNTVVSTGATIGNYNSSGFWLDGTTGNARFGGNLSVGQSVYISNVVVNGSLANAIVAYNNMVPGTIPAPSGGTTNIPTSVSVSNSTGYDTQYTGGTITGYYKTIAYTTIPVTDSTANANPQIKFNVSFNATVNASGVPSGASNPAFYVFANDNTFGGSGITLLIPASATPLPSGAKTNGSFVAPQYGRTFGGATSYSGNITIGTQFSFALSGISGNIPAGTSLAMGVGFFNGSATGGSATGTITVTNISWNVSPG